MRHLQTIIGVLLILAGAFMLAYKEFTYTKTNEDHVDFNEALGVKRDDIALPNFTITTKEKKRQELPMWLGWTLLATGVVVLVVPTSRRR